MLSLRPSHGSNPLTDHGMRVLYLSSGGSAIDTATSQQLAKAVGPSLVTQVESAGAALTELRSATTEYRALLISPGFNEQETLAVIRGLRNEGAAIAIVPIVTEAHRGLVSSAVRAGAEAVLLMVNGVLIDAQETLSRILPRSSATPPAAKPPATVAATQRALAELRKLHALLYGKGKGAATEEESSEFAPGEGGRLGLTPPTRAPREAASPAGAEVMPEKPRATQAPAATASAHMRRPVLASVPAARDPRTTDKTFDSRTRAALEAALQASRVELRRAADAHAAEREVWEATRKELEARFDEENSGSRGRVDLESELSEAKKKFGATTDAYAAERATWETARRELEMRVKTLQAVIGGTRRLEAELKTTQAELQERMAADSTKEAAWDEIRQRLEAELESRANDLEWTDSARARAEEALQSVQAELQQISNARHEAAAEWEETRRELEQQVIEARSAASESVRTDSASIEQTRTEIYQAKRAADEAASDAEQARAEADAIKEELEARNRSLDELRSEHAKLAANYRALEGKLSESRERIRQLSDATQRQPARMEAAAPIAAAEQRREVSRVEQVGKLGTAMAPEIEALVSSIDQYASRLVRQFDASHPQRADAEAILKNSSRATSLLRQLVTFSRRQAKPVARVELNDVIKRAEPTLARLLGGDIELKLALGQAGTLTMGEDEVEQLLTALVFSAREALTMGGSVLLSTSAVFADHGTSGQSGARVLVAAMAFGYGVQSAKSSSALDGVVRRCGGELTLGGEPNRDAIVQVSLPVA
ncbi:MAG TPA: hypothetical protein VES67_15810 [Vicinamibacterales bacterium]|nr:hypothetical protein [Vicinamibacterales bacterium]